MESQFQITDWTTLLMSSVEWMCWTWPTFLFFFCIFQLILIMVIWEIKSPSFRRKGLLPMPTTRGDRLFVGLLMTAFFHLLWLGLSDLSVWGIFLASIPFMAAVLRWG